MPDDRFADLGPSRPEGDDRESTRRRTAGERFAELDETDPEADAPKAPGPPPRRGRYTWVVGIVFLLAVIVAGANSLSHSGAGFRGVPAGKPLAPFAAPLATSDHDNDVSVQARRSGGHPAACSVRGPGIVNLCDLRRRPLVMTFVANGGADCASQLDRIEHLRASLPQVTFVGVLSRKSLGDAGKMVRAHGWRFDVVLDRDGQLLNFYGIGDCPTTIFAHAGGRSAGSRRGFLSDARLREDIGVLLRSPRSVVP